MFLKELKGEEGVAFINLVNQFAKVDDRIAKEERKLIEEYLEELGLDKSVAGKMDFDEVLESLNNSTERTKNIIYFELVGLALADGNYEDREINFLDKVSEAFDIKRTKKIAFANYFFNFKEIYDYTVVDADEKIDLLKEKAEALL